MKSNLANPFYRTVTVPNVPRLSFAFLYGRNFIAGERATEKVDFQSATKNSPLFQIKSLARLQELFPVDAIAKVQSSGDVMLLCPWYNLCSPLSVNFNNGGRMTFDADQLVIPLQEKDNYIVVFFVCEGLNE